MSRRSFRTSFELLEGRFFGWRDIRENHGSWENTGKYGNIWEHMGKYDEMTGGLNGKTRGT